jgi:hypothetical protein
MYCNNCGKHNPENSNFCRSCGAKITKISLSHNTDMGKNHESPQSISTTAIKEADREVGVEKPKADIEKIKKGFKNTGNSVYAAGWLTILVNVGIYLWSVLDNNYAEYGIPAGDLSGTFLMIVAGSIFIILGNRIRGLVDKNIKLYLQILFGLSLLLLVWIISTGGRVGLLLFIVIVYLIFSLISIRKAMKVEEFTTTLTSPKYKLDKKGWIIFAVIAVVLFFVTVGIDLSGQGNSYSKTEFINTSVGELKASMSLPYQVDEVTKLVEITAESDAIRYHYILSGIDTNKLSNASLKSNVGSSICQDNDIKTLLNQGINMEYSYTVEDSYESYFVLFTKADCSQ